jgi:hypothetical protein
MRFYSLSSKTKAFLFRYCIRCWPFCWVSLVCSKKLKPKPKVTLRLSWITHGFKYRLGSKIRFESCFCPLLPVHIDGYLIKSKHDLSSQKKKNQSTICTGTWYLIRNNKILNSNDVMAHPKALTIMEIIK